MVFNFDNSKKVFLLKRDKSSINCIDKPISNLCHKLNKKNDYFTTSSCSGRIVLIKDEVQKMPGLFLFRSHEKINFKNFKEELNKSLKNFKGTILFKQEPSLLVVACRNNASQCKLFSLARNNGWKKSGILSLNKKFLVEIMSTENISFPVCNNGKILVNDSFLKIVLKKSNFNLSRGWRKIERLEELIEKLNQAP